MWHFLYFLPLPHQHKSLRFKILVLLYLEGDPAFSHALLYDRNAAPCKYRRPERIFSLFQSSPAMQRKGTASAGTEPCGSVLPEAVPFSRLSSLSSVGDLLQFRVDFLRLRAAAPEDALLDGAVDEIAARAELEVFFIGRAVARRVDAMPFAVVPDFGPGMARAFADRDAADVAGGDVLHTAEREEDVRKVLADARAEKRCVCRRRLDVRDAGFIRHKFVNGDAEALGLFEVVIRCFDAFIKAAERLRGTRERRGVGIDRERMRAQQAAAFVADGDALHTVGKRGMTARQPPRVRAVAKTVDAEIPARDERLDIEVHLDDALFGAFLRNTAQEEVVLVDGRGIRIARLKNER